MQNHSRRDSELTIKKEIQGLKPGDYFKGIVKILRRSRPGPIIFIVSDGYGTVEAVIKDSTFIEGDVVYLSGLVNERGGSNQVEIKKIEKSDKDLDKVFHNKSEPRRTEFSITNEVYKSMKDYFIGISWEIRKAILSNQPIMIRHHNDADGIISGLNLEWACKSLMEDVGINPDYNLYRNPCKAPYYTAGDVFRDLTLFKKIENFGSQKPLIIILDNGSSPEDIFGLKTLKLLGYETIVIDHHNPVEIRDKKTTVCSYLKHHLNPYIEGFDGSICAGMLTYELARMVWENYERPVLPATAGISDRSDSKVTEKYLEKAGREKEFLIKLGAALDFMAYQLRHDGGKGVYDELFENPELVEHIYTEITKGVETQLQSTLPYLRSRDCNGVIFSHIDLEKYTLRFTYPNPGKILGLVHDEVVKENSQSPVLTIGYLTDSIIVRANQPVLPVQKIIDTLNQNIPAANVNGGGHEQAGAIKFVPAHLQEILELIKDMIQKKSKS